MKCSNCNEKILISDAEVCPYCGSTNLVPNSTLTIKDKKEIKKMETEGRILDLAKKYEELEMWDKAKEYRKKLKLMDIEKLEKAGRYEEAAKKYEELEMWDKAG